MQERLLKCKVCDYEARQLHQHIKAAHNLTALAYREIYGETECMQIGFDPSNKLKDPHHSNYVKQGYADLQQRLGAYELYTQKELYAVLLKDDSWLNYLGKAKYRTMISDDPRLYKSILFYTKSLNTTLENRMKYIVKFNFDLSKCYCKCGHRLTYGKLYCRKCPELKRIKVQDKLLAHYKTGVWYNKQSISVIEAVAKEYDIIDIMHAENGGEYRVCGYSVDGYSPSKNTVIEYDEKHHFTGNLLRSRDLIRQANIKKELDCKFVRINYKNEVYYAE